MVGNNPEGQITQPSVEPAAPPRSAPSGPDPFEQMARAMAEEIDANEKARGRQLEAARDRGDDTKELEGAHARIRDLERIQAEQRLQLLDIGGRLYSYTMEDAVKDAAEAYGLEPKELRALALKTAKNAEDVDRIAYRMSRRAERDAKKQGAGPKGEEEEEPVYDAALPARGGPNLKDMNSTERLRYELEQLHRRQSR